jgi:hypothetical protein
MIVSSLGFRGTFGYQLNLSETYALLSVGYMRKRARWLAFVICNSSREVNRRAKRVLTFIFPEDQFRAK